MVRNCGPSVEGPPERGGVPHRIQCFGPQGRTDNKDSQQMLRGSITALITPFANGAVDEKAFSAFVDWQIHEGTMGLVPVGTTGESPTLSHEEHRRVVEICVKVANKRVPVIAGAGSNSTA